MTESTTTQCNIAFYHNLAVRIKLCNVLVYIKVNLVTCNIAPSTTLCKNDLATICSTKVYINTNMHN